MEVSRESAKPNSNGLIVFTIVSLSLLSLFSLVISTLYWNLNDKYELIKRDKIKADTELAKQYNIDSCITEAKKVRFGFMEVCLQSKNCAIKRSEFSQMLNDIREDTEVCILRYK